VHASDLSVVISMLYLMSLRHSHMGPPILGCSLEQEYGVITEVNNKQSHIERCQMAIEDFDKRHEDGGPRKSFLEGRQSSKFGGYCISYPTIRRDQGNVHDSSSFYFKQSRTKIADNLSHRANEAFRRQPHAPMGAPR